MFGKVFYTFGSLSSFLLPLTEKKTHTHSLCPPPTISLRFSYPEPGPAPCPKTHEVLQWQRIKQTPYLGRVFVTLRVFSKAGQRVVAVLYFPQPVSHTSAHWECFYSFLSYIWFHQRGMVVKPFFFVIIYFNFVFMAVWWAKRRKEIEEKMVNVCVCWSVSPTGNKCHILFVRINWQSSLQYLCV